MKNNIYIYAIVLLTVLFSACNKDFLQRVPQSEVTAESFFNTAQDLETYTNGFYSQISAPYDDLGSDNISSYSEGGEVYNMLRGSITPSTVGGWDDWGNLRSINFMLDHIEKVDGDSASIDHYIGIARFFRAWFYFKKIKRYSDVPWYSHAEPAGDTSLYKPADPRSVVVDSVLADLQYAVEHIKPARGNGTRVNKWSALQLMARFCLFEGTFRKYHAEVELKDDYERFLRKAIWAAQEIMESGEFGITGNGGEGYRALFTSTSLSGNNEIIQWA